MSESDYVDNLLYSEFEVLGEDPAPMATTKTLGTATIGATLKTYSFRVPNCARGVTHVKIAVSEGGLFADTVGAQFSEGADKTARVNRTFNAGYQSPWLGMSLLNPNGRCITKVYIKGRSSNPNLASRLTAYGKINE